MGNIIGIAQSIEINQSFKKNLEDAKNNNNDNNDNNCNKKTSIIRYKLVKHSYKPMKIK